MTEYHLDIFPGDFDLPSLDPECLLTLTYCRFSGIPVKIHHQTNLFSHKVPALRTSKQTIYGSDKIIEFFETKNLPSNNGMMNPADLKLKLRANKTMAKERLEPCLQLFWWNDLDNYNQFLRAWYAKHLPFPTNFFIPNSLRKKAIAKLESKFSTKIIESESKWKVIENEVTNDARCYLNLMNENMIGQNFCFGDKPTSIDAVLFTYLSLLYKVPTKNTIIQNHIVLTDSLKNYVDRILKMYFNGARSNTFKESAFNNSGNNENDSFSRINWNDVIFSGVVAGLLMVFYAFSKGIVRINNDDDENDEHDEIPQEQHEEHE